MYLRFQHKKILLGVCGGIAAYKACDLTRELYRQGAEKVQVIMTASAEQFITALTLESLSRQPVLYNNLSNNTDGVPWHIALAQDYNAFLILPATANTMAKLACGIADDLLTTTALTFTDKPLLIAPAMNYRMWDNPLLQDNLHRLVAMENVRIIEPDAGSLACGEYGEGKLAQQAIILDYLYQALHTEHNLLATQNIVVTAGGTSESIDPARMITNRSSGQMGVAMADEAWAMGANVTLIHTLPHLPQKPYDTLYVQTVDTMADAVLSKFKTATLLIMAAAVSDYKVAKPADQKLKKQDSTTLELTKTRDILMEVASVKQAHQTVIGFAAETNLDKQQLLEKLERKKLDVLACNDISRNDIAFGSEDNEVTLLFPDGTQRHLYKTFKQVIAQQILNYYLLRPLSSCSC